MKHLITLLITGTCLLGVPTTTQGADTPKGTQINWALNSFFDPRNGAVFGSVRVVAETIRDTADSCLQRLMGIPQSSEPAPAAAAAAAAQAHITCDPTLLMRQTEELLAQVDQDNQAEQRILHEYTTSAVRAALLAGAAGAAGYAIAGSEPAKRLIPITVDAVTPILKPVAACLLAAVVLRQAQIFIRNGLGYEAARKNEKRKAEIAKMREEMHKALEEQQRQMQAKHQSLIDEVQKLRTIDILQLRTNVVTTQQQMDAELAKERKHNEALRAHLEQLAEKAQAEAIAEIEQMRKLLAERDAQLQAQATKRDAQLQAQVQAGNAEAKRDLTLIHGSVQALGNNTHEIRAKVEQAEKRLDGMAGNLQRLVASDAAVVQKHGDAIRQLQVQQAKLETALAGKKDKKKGIFG
jgi:hypothetical protein